MGAKLAVALVAVFALATGFWWYSSSEEVADAAPLRPGTEEAAVPARPASADLERPDRVEPEAESRRTEAQPTTAVVADREAPEAPRNTQVKSGSVHGRVVDAAGRPIAGAEVTASNDYGFPLLVGHDHGAGRPGFRRAQTTTDADGRFDLRGLEAGELRLAVRAGGFAPYDEGGIPLPSTEDYELDEVQLVRGARLAGRVIDPSGVGVEGARLVPRKRGEFGLFESREALAVTGSNGEFLVEHLACGDWRLAVESEDHPDAIFEGSASDPGMLVQDLVFELEVGTTLTGRVVGMPGSQTLSVLASHTSEDGDGRLILGSSRLERPRRARVQSDGGFTLRGVRPDELYALRAVASGQHEVSGFFIGGSSRSDTVRARGGESGVELVYNPEAVLVFQVVDDEKGTPLTEFEVRAGTRWPAPLLADGRQVTEHPEGRVRFGGLHPRDDHARASLEIDAVGYEDYVREDIQLESGEEVDLGVIRLRPLPLVRITVLDDLTGDPIAGARVSLTERREEPAFGFSERRMSIEIDASSDSDGPVVSTFGERLEEGTTDENGLALLTSLAGLAAVLEVETETHAPLVLDLDLPEKGGVDRTVRLTRGGTALVQVVDSDGAPVSGVRVEHKAPHEDRGVQNHFFGMHGKRFVTDREGRVTFPRLAPGVHAFRVGDDGGLSGFESSGGEQVFITTAGVGGDEAEPWSEVTIREGLEAELVLTTTPRGSLEGQILEGGLPLVGASLSLEEAGADDFGIAHAGMFGGGPRARTDGEGRYRFDDLKVGEYELTIDHSSRVMSSEFEVELREAGSRFDVNLPVAIVEGRITDPDGEPLVGVRVTPERSTPGRPQVRMMFVTETVDGDDGMVSFSDGMDAPTAETDSDGYYQLRGVATDVDLTIVANGDGVQEGRSELFQVAPDEVLDGVNFSLQPAGSVRVTATDAEGNPARFMMVTAEYQDGEVPEERNMLGQNGKTTLTGLRPGRWLIEVAPLQGVSLGGSSGEGEQLVNVVAGEEALAEIQL